MKPRVARVGGTCRSEPLTLPGGRLSLACGTAWQERGVCLGIVGSGWTLAAMVAADAARAFKPKILYPYHQGKSDPAEVKRLLADVKEIEVRVLALP